MSNLELCLPITIETVKNQCKLLANGVRHVLNLGFSDTFLETIYIPFLSHFIYWNSIESRARMGEKYVKNMGELLKLSAGKDCLGDISAFSNTIDYNKFRCDLTLNTKLNLYEKFVYVILGISYFELKEVKSKEDLDIKPDFAARASLKKYFQDSDNYIENLIDLLPLTLFEGLRYVNLISNNQNPICHWLGQIYNESYLFYLGAIRENGTVIIGQPHGGAYCQILGGTANELAERALANAFYAPSWLPLVKPFSNWRASRNLFLNIKSRILNKAKKKNRILVLLGYFYDDIELRPVNPVVNNNSFNGFYEDRLMRLTSHFPESFDFKLYVRQKNDCQARFDFLKKMYCHCEFITSGGVLEVSRGYESVIHMDTWGTAIIELAATGINQYVYLGPELSLNKDYESFLWNSRRGSTRTDYSDGVYVLIDNASYRSAYGASFFYPFYFAALINRIKRQVKKQRAKLFY